ncbi:hypothetical protein [Altibacter lentus]|uniref:hypothetical protein n=1 Tax=Altibacter lentus TaxID=1223410 RepID=UPI00054DE728|nr:hypothetical protein [Altibacter lentus]
MESIKTSKPSYFFLMAIVGLLAVLIGFAKTFIIPITEGSFSAPGIVYVHGAFTFSWITLFFIQTFLININKYRLHMTLGIVGVLIAIGTTFTMVPVGLYAVHKELGLGFGDTAISGFLGVLTSALMFISLVLAGVINRKNGAAHKRLMLLATLVVLWPAWFRFRHYFPDITRPDIWFAVVLADSWILIAILWDKWKNGSVHPVLKYVGAFIILEHVLEVLFFDTPTWRVVAKFIHQLVS